MNRKIWQSFFNNIKSISKKDLNKEQIIEFNLIKSISEKLLISNLNRSPTFEHIYKTVDGYSVFRVCQLDNCFWTVHINIINSLVTITCNKDCQHKNPRKRSLFILVL